MSTINTFIGIFTSIIFSQETQLFYVVIIHWTIGVFVAGIPLMFASFVSYQYMKLWKKNILDLRSTLFRTTPKAADTIISNLKNLKIILIIINIAAMIFTGWCLLVGSLIPLIARNATASYLVLIGADLILPLFLFLASLPTAIQAFRKSNKRKWNDLIEDIQYNMSKSMGTLVNSEELEVAGVKPFELRPVRTESQVDRMER